MLPVFLESERERASKKECSRNLIDSLLEVRVNQMSLLLDLSELLSEGNFLTLSRRYQTLSQPVEQYLQLLAHSASVDCS